MSPKVGAEHLCTGAGTGERSLIHDLGGFAGVMIVTSPSGHLLPPHNCINDTQVSSWKLDQLVLGIFFASAKLALQLDVLPYNLLDVSLAGTANKGIIILFLAAPH